MMNLSAINKTITLLGKLFDPRRPTEPFLPQNPDKPAYQKTPIPYFPRVTPEAVGISSRHVAAFLEELENDPTLNLHSVVLSRGGKVFCEASFGMQDTRIWKYTFSASKSVVSLAVGILIGQNLLHLDDKLVDLFSDRIGPVAKLRLAPITVRDLLTMRSGVVFNEAEAMTDGDWIKCYLNSAVSGEIGKTFNYNSMNTYMLSAIICKKTKMTLCGFLDRYLFGPMEITDYYWERCPRGIEKGGWGLYILPEDMLKLTTLILSDGVWKGKTLVPAAYLRDAVTAHTETPSADGNYDYGYQMWVGRASKSFLFNGMLGQNMFGYPETGIAAATNAGNAEMFQQSHVYEIIDRYFSKTGDTVQADSMTALPQDIEGEELLHKTIQRLKGIPPKAEEPVREPEIPAEKSAPKPADVPSFKNFLQKLFPAAHPASPVIPAEVPEEKKPAAAFALPDKVHLLLDRTFVCAEGEPASAVGLLPVVMQVMQNNYTKGFSSLSFAVKTEDGEPFLYLTYREQDEHFTFPVSMMADRKYFAQKILRTRLYFHGEPFLVSAAGYFTTDEDGNDVFRLRCDFPETPCSRVIKLIFRRDGILLLRQEELPGAELISQTVIGMKAEIESQPVIGGAVEKLDNDYLDYRVRRTFAPELRLRIHTEN